MSNRWLALILSVVAMFGSALAQNMPAGHGAHHPSFDDPERWAKSFDDPERDRWQKPDEVIAALGLKPTDRVADIGAGTGYFTLRLAPKVSKGLVIAVDIEPKMVAWISERAKQAGLSNVFAVRGSEASPNLPEAVDVMLFVDVYHHIGARDAYFKGLQRMLRSGGRIVIVDFRPEAESGAPKEMRIAPEVIEAEMKASGYQLSQSHSFLPHQYFLIFERAD